MRFSFICGGEKFSSVGVDCGFLHRSSMSKLITVFGATGQQGGAVVEALLATGEFKVRGITRDVKSAKADALTKKGVEVVEGNIVDAKSVKKVIANSYGVFLVTDNQEKEFEIGKQVVDAAIEAKVTHFIWSTLINCHHESKGKYTVSLFTDKSKVEEYAKKAGFTYHTYVAAPGYYQNWGTSNVPKKNEDGSLTFNLPIKPDTKFWQGDIREIGTVVANAFKNPKGWGSGDFIALGAEETTLTEMLHVLSDHLKVKITSTFIPREVFSKFFPGADAISEMYEYLHEYPYYGSYDPTTGHKAKGSALKTFREYLQEVNFQFTSFR